MLAAPQSKAESDLYDPPAHEGGAQYFPTFMHRERKEPQFDGTEKERDLPKRSLALIIKLKSLRMGF